MSEALHTLVAALPEIYQPLYGHPELAQTISRTCEDRLAHLFPLHDALAETLQRPVRVLDLGCAQGYISLSMAARGADVTGIDFNAANVAVCQALAAEHGEWTIRFEQAHLEIFIDALSEDAYDLVLGLSVFHHVAHEHGATRALELVDMLAQSARMSAYELAQADEPLYWGPSQPRDQDWLRAYSFQRELARFPTHLSDISRPLYVASTRYWYLGDCVQPYEHSNTDSHALAQGTHQGTRHYFFGDGLLAKLMSYRGPGDYNRLEFRREVAMLRQPPAEFVGVWPALQASGEDECGGWLVRELLSGELLLDVIMRGGDYEPQQVIGEVLEQLVVLERHGLHHGDLQVWNILLTREGHAVLIDYGAIVAEPTDSTWPDERFLAFFAFVHDTVLRRANKPTPLLPPYISPHELPMPYAAWIHAGWKKPRAEWSFADLQESFVAACTEASQPVPQDRGDQLWQAAVEHHLAWTDHYVLKSLQHQGHELNQLAARHEALDAGVKGMAVGSQRQAEQQSSLAVALTSMQASLNQLTDRHEALDRALSGVAGGSQQQAKQQADLVAVLIDTQTSLNQLTDRHEALDRALIGVAAGGQQQVKQQADLVAVLIDTQTSLNQLTDRHEALDRALIGVAAGGQQQVKQHADLTAALNGTQASLKQLVERHEALERAVIDIAANSQRQIEFATALTDTQALLDRLSDRQEVGVTDLRAQINSLHAGLQQVTVRYDELHGRLLSNEQERARLQGTLDQMQNSRSFRLTRPLRSAADEVRGARASVILLLRSIWHRMVLYRWMRTMVLTASHPFPRWRDRVHASIAAHRVRASIATPSDTISSEEQLWESRVDLSPGAQHIHEQLVGRTRGRFKTIGKG